MHGTILYGLKQFVVEHYDEDAWDAIVESAEIERTLRAGRRRAAGGRPRPVYARRRRPL